MNDGQLRIRIGATADRSIDTVFGNIEKRAIKTRDNINKAFGASGTQSMGGMERAAKKAADGVDKVWNDEMARLNKLAREQDRLHARVEANKVKQAASSARERVKIEEKAARDIEKATRESHRRAERDERQRAHAAAALDRQRSRALYQQHREAESTRRQFAERTAWRATKFLVPPPVGALGHAQRIAGGLIRGAGIDTSIQGGVSRAVSLQARAIGLANAERTATGSTAGAAHYQNLARTVGDQTFSSADSVMSLQSGFAAGSGAYGALGEITPQLASMARASGANFDDVGSAAAKVYNQLKDGPDAIAKTVEVMRAIIGQAAEGAVDMDEYASQIGRIAAGGFKFEGDRGTNIAKLSALTQLGMERGATSAADASRATTSFVNTLGKGARLKAFEKAGVRVYSDDTLDKSGNVVAGKQRDTLRDPFEIIKDSFRATGGNIPQLGNMFMDVLGRKGVESLGAVYKGAGGGEAGIKAIDAEIGRYMSKTLTKDTEKKNLADISNSVEAKAQRFQNNLDRIAESMVQNLLPAMEKLGPTIEMLASAFAKMVSFSVDHPVLAITAALVGAITRAGIESAIRGGVERMIMRAAAGGGGGNGGLGGRLTGLTAGSRIGAAAGLGGAIGIPLASAILTDGIGSFESSEERMKAEGHALNAALSSNDPAVVAAAISSQRERVAKLKKGGDEWTDHMPVVGAAWNWATNKDETKAVELNTAQANLDRMESYAQMLAEQRAMRQQLSQGIRITNLNELKNGAGPSVDGNGRSKDPGK